MPTTHDIHNDIEPWLAAAVHDELSPEERAAFDAHLATCANCRALHHDAMTMNVMIADTLFEAKPDLGFEQRILAKFHSKVPIRIGFLPLLIDLLQSRATRIAAVAIILLSFVWLGAWLTTSPSLGNEELAVQAVSSSDSLRGLRDQLGVVEFTNSAEGRRILGESPQPLPSSSHQQVEVLRQLPSDSASVATPASAPPPMESAPFMAMAESISVQQAPPAMLNQKQSTAVDEIAEGATEPAPDVSVGVPDNRKLIRNAQVELEVLKFDEAVQSITALAGEGRGFVATSSSEKQANGKLRGQVVVKVLPESLDAFLLKLRGLGELKNQTLGTQDVTKEYLDTDSRLKNARAMELRVLDILKTKTSKVADLLEVEKELGRVREQIEQMQGALKYMDAQVQFATVTITLAEKDMNTPAAFLLKRRARLALFSTGVEQTFAEVRGVVDGAKAQVSSSTLDRDSTGEATARLVLLIVPEEADALIERIKGMGRVQNYNEQTDRIAQGGGSGMAENAKVERDKVELSITISRNEQEPALQTTSLRILTSQVTEKVARLKENATKSGAEIRSSSFSRDPDGQEIANITLRVAMKNYAALLSSFDQLGKVKDVSVQREDRRGVVNEETAPADISVQVYSQANIVGDETGLFATIRRTLAQGAAALMWSLRMIGVALAFVAPWALTLALVVWILKRVARARKARE